MKRFKFFNFNRRKLILNEMFHMKVIIKKNYYMDATFDKNILLLKLLIN